MTGYKDQLAAAEAEVESAALDMAGQATGEDRSVTTTQSTSETWALVLLNMVDPSQVCEHLQRVPIQASFARLATRRVTCKECAAAAIVRDPSQEQRCSWCGTTDISGELLIAMGRLLVLGAECRACHDRRS